MEDRTSKVSKMRVALFANIFICVAVLLVPILMPKGEKVAIIMPPWSEAQDVLQVIANAGGALVNGGRRDWIAIATSDSNNFVKELYEAGAAIVIDGSIAAACL